MEPLTGLLSNCRILVLSINIMEVANTLAYYDKATIMAFKSFIARASRVDHLKGASLGKALALD